MKNLKTIVFSPAIYNLAETTRCIEIAKACKDYFNIHFISYGGDFEHIIEKEGYEITRLEPQLTPEKVKHLYKVDQGQKFSSYFTEKEIRQQVNNEIAFFKKVKPVAVVTGFNFSNNISCRVEKIPLLWLTHTTWMIESGYRKRLFTYPDMLDLPVLRWFGEKNLIKLSLWAFATFGKLIYKPYNNVAREFGTLQFNSMEDIWLGDYNLLAEPDDFCDLETPSSFHYIGPLIGKLDAPIPNEILNLPKDKPIVFFAMGSSGQPKVIKKIIEGFEGKPYRVIAPVKSKIKNINIKIPSNVIVTDLLPTHKVNPMADISVIHGGIGTVMTAILAGKPVVGISMMAEQEANIDCLVKKGYAIRIRKNRFTPKKLYAAIETLLADENAKASALAYKQSTEKWLNRDLITDFFVREFKENKQKI
ncbi:MAG: glycosyltransferase [Paludibacter sp.]|nr:glycosyltransferase [Paludibacter sp.]MDD4428873.1 glycosyltransferase [Paludibacter sp.]